MALMRVYVDGKWRITESAREIKRGRNRGHLEVEIAYPVTKQDGWEMRLRKRIVKPERVRVVG